ncbi:hypothetical protein [Candidatus Pantoea soli]|uniref:hypothetical protein n=1 Tax=Candidatus Pantoea soli TaxID=3098669 RepID=UPI0011A107BB|nr:hypothetical protein [Pantoea soli]
MCDVEQRLNTENINLLTQSSKESISLPYCTFFDQKIAFLPGFNAGEAAITAAVQREKVLLRIRGEKVI